MDNHSDKLWSTKLFLVLDGTHYCCDVRWLNCLGLIITRTEAQFYGSRFRVPIWWLCRRAKRYLRSWYQRYYVRRPI